MRVMVIVKANQESESGALPSTESLLEMSRFNEELLKAGVMLSAEGLRPSSKGARISFADGNGTVTDGPFIESKELIAGYWLWQVKSIDEAVEWLRRSPFKKSGAEVEIRPVLEAEDFGASLTPEIRARAASRRERLATNN
jgi:hypothetical protein